MTDKSAAELEKDAETARARVVSTANSIRDKMSPGQLIDEFAGMFSGADGKGALSNLKNQVRENPLALSLVGAGLVWLMVGQPVAGSASSAWDKAKAQAKRSTPPKQEYAYGQEAIGGGAWDTVADAAGSVADAAKDAASSARAAASGAFDRVAGGVTTAGTVTDSALRKVEGVVQQEPLVLAALGFAVGAAIGGLLPRSDLEDRAVGDLSGQIRDKADELVKSGLQKGKEVAAEAFETVKDEADKQGLTDNGPFTIAQQVGEVAKAAASKVEESLRDKLS